MSRRSAKNLIRAAGIGELNDSNGRWYVPTARLRARLPDVFERVRTMLAALDGEKIIARKGGGRSRVYA